MARGKKKRDKKRMWVAKPGDKIVVSRTAAIPSKKLSRRGSGHWKRSRTYIPRCLEMCYPTHLGILLRITIGLRMGSIES
jgi:hypothetical protein